MPKFLKQIIGRVKLELMVTYYIRTCYGPVFSREARRQARQLILDGPYNPLR
jgi:hypothetical protein